MLFSRSVDYAIQALGRLAEASDGEQVMARVIAEEEQLPAFFLAKTLQNLARHGLLKSTKGPTGGFSLSKPADKIRILDVVEALDGLDHLQTGQDGLPNFKQLRSTIMGYLKNTTIADVAALRKRSRRKKSKS
ncbi:MAG: Rrf2 family transcriptional regulator [Bryobacterales bacterium]|nr:Rrf2 family transcriptional regulator [Bryobacterales bacterium]